MRAAFLSWVMFRGVQVRSSRDRLPLCMLPFMSASQGLQHCSNGFSTVKRRCFLVNFQVQHQYEKPEIFKIILLKEHQHPQRTWIEGVCCVLDWKRAKAHSAGTRAFADREAFKRKPCTCACAQGFYAWVWKQRWKICIMHHATQSSTHPGIMSQGEITCTRTLPHALTKEL